MRFGTNPLVRVGEAGVGDNANGPSVVRVPEWVSGRMGKYYMYFAHHAGDRIRLAYADRVEGPWRVHERGTLRVEQTPFGAAESEPHVASPDVHVDAARGRLVMFYHGGYLRDEFRDVPAGHGQGEDGNALSERAKRLMYRQATAVAESRDGVMWNAIGGLIGLAYWRRFEWRGRFYALAMPGVFYASSPPTDGVSGFQRLGVELFNLQMRHAAVLVDGDQLQVFYSNAGDTPESILMATVALDRDWRKWRVTGTETILLPEQTFEGGDLPVETSQRGVVYGRARQLRDPCVLVDEGRRYLFYSYAGEQGIAGAELLTE